MRIPNAHEAIIDADTWARTQTRLNSNTRVGHNMQELSPLSGKVRCAFCGRPMKRNVYYNTAKTIKYYGLQCASYKTGAMNCTNKRTMSGKVLEEMILSELNSIITMYCQTDELRHLVFCEGQLKTLEGNLSRLNSQHEAAQSRLVQMYKDKADGLISAKEYALFRKSLSDEEKDLSKRIREVKQQIKNTRTRMANAAEQKALIEKYTHFDTLDRTIADEFIDYIEIGMTDDIGEREIHIHWKL